MHAQHTILYSAFALCSLVLHNKVTESRTISLSVKEEMPQNTSVGLISYLHGNDTLDKDTRLTYSFLPQGYPHTGLFSIGASTGKLVTAEVLDREELCGFFPKCQLDLEVAIQSTHQQLFQKVKVTVDVIDTNDNAPEFPSKSIILKISESVSVNSTFAIQGAVDKDVGKNSLETYDIIRGEGVFDINIRKNLDGGRMVNLIVLEPLDREFRDFYRVYVIAKDGGIPRKSSLLMLNLTILDVNDNAPEFTQSVYTTSIKEVTPPGSAVLHVAATDKDSPDFWEPSYRFSALQAGEFRQYFAINSSTGVLTVISPLAQIQGKTIKFVVECVDGGLPPFVAQTEVQIKVLDTINSAPNINLNVLSKGRVSELADVGTVVAHVSAVDPDSGRNGLVKCFVHNDMFEIHALDVNDYKVTIGRSLDREERSWYNVTVLCEDAGSPTLTSMKHFTVQVEDENDNIPQFSQYAYELQLIENNPVDHLVLQLTATDPDTGSNGDISYHIPNSKKLGVSISKSGKIMTEKSFDREESPHVSFVVIASDGGNKPNSVTLTVVINIQDVNDFTPTFSQDHYVFAIEENLPTGVHLGTIFPLDLDEGINKELVLNIELPFEEFEHFPFVITSEGDLMTNSLLDREARSQYTFSIAATDKGRPPLSSTTAIVVNVVDVNDNSPIILTPNADNCTVTIADDTEPGTAIFPVLAADNDAGPNGHLQYYLTPDSDHELFHLHRESGIVYLKHHLDSSHRGVYPLFIMVRDQGVPFKWTNATLEISILSDNQTVLSQRQQAKENTTIALIMGSVTGVIAIGVILTIIFIRKSDRDWSAKRGHINIQVNTDQHNDGDKSGGIVVLDAESISSGSIKGKGSLSGKKKSSHISHGWNFLPGVAVDSSTASTKSSKPHIRKRSADSNFSCVSANDSGKGGSDDEACNEETSSELESKLQCDDNVKEVRAHNNNVEQQLPRRQSSDYVHLSANIADVTTLSNYSYYYPGCKQQEVTSDQRETRCRTKRVSFRFEPNSERFRNGSRQTEHSPEVRNNEDENSYHDNTRDVHVENQLQQGIAFRYGEEIIFDLDLQKLNDVLV